MIKIIEGYGFEHDSQQFILYRTGKREKLEFGTKNKTGQIVEYKELVGFYTNLATVCMAVLNLETKRAAESAGVDNLGDYLAIMERISQEIKAAVETTAF